MKTVSTKLDKSDFEKFEQMCNEDDMCISEWLREMIRDNLRSHEEARELEQESLVVEPTIPLEPTITIVGV